MDRVELVCGVRQLTSLDAQFLALESPRQSGHVGMLMLLDPSTAPGGELTLDAFQRVIAQRLVLVPPLRWRLVEVPLGLDHGYWLDDPDFDLDFHVRELALPTPGSDDMLAEQVARIVARPLDRARPLWEIYLLHGVHGDKIGVLTKIHHALIDGLSGAEILGALLDLTPEIRQVEPDDGVHGDRMPGTVELLGRGLVGLAGYPLRVARALPTALPHLEEIRQLGPVPGVRALGRLAGLVRRGFGGGPVVRGFGGLEAPRTPFSEPLSPHRRFGFGGLSLADVKAVKRAHKGGVTVNDVIVSLCAGAVRRWLVAHDALPDRPLVAGIPISVRTPEQAGTYGNQIHMLTAPLLTDVADPVRRLRATHDALAAMKETQRGMPAALLSDVSHFIPPAMFSRAAQLSFALSTGWGGRPAWNLVVSNVPGPQFPMYMAGAKVLATYPVSVITDGMGLNITVMSYCGSVDVGIVADRDQVSDVQTIVEHLREELAVLTSAAPQAPRR
ncbi:WS/DGAT/MGAT family O-acyltransferase [Pseudonocardia acaciae]|uniref:WS/DGAT/MGAT family O-acyltransferase n=1 Tax=Pseudonocardia acaciae TaxID=551276 RepID=UPI0012EE11CA|nr:wax ester/triacylglycerol synthase family O-acyltransferase [Pseudonocardia acaciae]